jgi:predicted Co/Zn/Cd cation transporter (cation efflux family)
MADDAHRHERKALTASIVATTVLGAVGVAWGWASGSQMILLDGAYGIIGTATSWLLLRASSLSVQGPSRAYPFGREAVTPLVIGIQGCVLLATLLYAGIEAVYTIFDGGSEFEAGPAVAYGVIITAACVAVWFWLQRGAGDSELLAAEATAWRIAAMRGLGMVLGFTILGLLEGSRWEDAAPYVDPVMVLVTCALFLPPPVGMVRRTLFELLERAPPDRVMDPVRVAVSEVVASYDLDDPDVRVTKIGSKLYVEVNGTAGAEVTIQQEHEVRESLRRRLADALSYDVWLNLELVPRPPTGEQQQQPRAIRPA